MAIVTEVRPDQLREYWFGVKDSLEEIRRNTNPDWIAEDIYAALSSRNATLFTIGADGGFMILQRQQSFHGPFLFVWIVWGPGDLAQYEQALYADLRLRAKQAGLGSIRFNSPRKGWERRGWKVKEIIYEMEIE